MENFLHIMSKPDNLPIAGMLIAVLYFLFIALRQAFRHDKHIAKGEKEKIYDEMIR